MVGLGQDQEQVQIEIELGVLSVESTTTLQENVQLDKKNREIEQIQWMFNLDNEQTALQTLLMETDDDEITITLTETRDSLTYKG